MLTNLSAVGGVDLGNVGIRGAELFVPNDTFASDFNFRLGMIRVVSGEVVTWSDLDRSEAPHTITIVEQADPPVDFPGNFFCLEEEQACAELLKDHFPEGEPPVFVIDSGEPGLDTPGDSLLFFSGGSASSVVSTPAGTTLYYPCAFHPWMQGTISVS